MTTQLPPDDHYEGEFEPESVKRMKRDLSKSASLLGKAEARYLVDAYYSIQDYRKAAANQLKALSKSGEPTEILEWMMKQMHTVEKCVGGSLSHWSNAHREGRWSRSVCGIGPIISAGLLCYVDVEGRPTAGHIWRFAGLDPSLVWIGKTEAERIVKEHGLNGSIAALSQAIGSKPEAILKFATHDKAGKRIKLTEETLVRAGARRPWNARFKTLCWKIGESFVKVSGREEDVYGKLWLKRRDEEWERNKQGGYSVVAKESLAKKKHGADTDARVWLTGSMPREAVAEYEKTEPKTLGLAPSLMRKHGGKPGCNVPMLPPGHIHARAKHYAVKIFLSHYHHVCWWVKYGIDPPVPFAMAKLGHAHYIPVPGIESLDSI